MRVTVLFFAVFLSIVCCLSSVCAESRIVPNRYIVRFTPVKVNLASLTKSQIMKILQKQNKLYIDQLKKKVPIKEITPLWIANSVAVTASQNDIKAIEQMPGVAEVIPVTYRIWIDKDINKKTVKNDLKVQWSIEKVRAPEVWSELKIDGSGVVVGQLDTGVAATHPLLKGKVLVFKDFTGTDAMESYDDQGHGTHTAGSILADDGVGVAPGARLIVAKVFSAQGGSQTDWLLAAMQWVMDPDGNPDTPDGPALVSNSWGSNDSADRSFWDAVQTWVSAGILPVFAAGNNGYYGGKVGTPGAFPHSWAVAATTSSDSLSGFSSQGPVTWDGVELTKPDIAAPGSSVISCSTSGGLVSNSGTSMACPHVAGLAALMYQADPTLSIDRIREIAESTSIDLGVPGKDTKFGSGRFDAYECIKKVLENSRSLHMSVVAYENALRAEAALAGNMALSPLAAPLARSIILRSKDLDDGEFQGLTAWMAENTSPAVQQLVKELISIRHADDLQR